MFQVLIFRLDNTLHITCANLLFASHLPAVCLEEEV